MYYKKGFTSVAFARLARDLDNRAVYLHRDDRAVFLQWVRGGGLIPLALDHRVPCVHAHDLRRVTETLQSLYYPDESVREIRNRVIGILRRHDARAYVTLPVYFEDERYHYDNLTVTLYRHVDYATFMLLFELLVVPTLTKEERSR